MKSRRYTKDGVDVAEEARRPECQQAIRTLIDIMTKEPVMLLMPRFDKEFIVKTDGAVTEGIGGMLNQHDEEGHERVCAYYGRKLSSAERNYTVTEIELLAALECIRTWRPYLWGRKFRLVTDHAALRWLHTMKDTIEGGPGSRLMRWALKLMEYNFEIEHKPGKIHSDADAVSRLVASVHHPTKSLYLDAKNRPHASKLLLWQPGPTPTDPLVYCWNQTPNGNLDLPGGNRTRSDSSGRHTLIRECDEELTVPLSLAVRIGMLPLKPAATISDFSRATVPGSATLSQQDTLQHVTELWTVAVDPRTARLVCPAQTGRQERHEGAFRPLSELIASSPQYSSLSNLPWSELDSTVNPPARTPTDALTALRSCFATATAFPELNGEEFEKLRTATVAAVWNNNDQSGHPSSRIVAVTTTARSLKQADRLARTAEVTRRSIVESYIDVGAPTTKTLMEAQADCSECAALRSFLATGYAGPLVGTSSLRLARWARKEARHMVVEKGGLLYRIDPVSPSLRVGVTPRDPTHRLYVPQTLRSAFLYAYHDRLGHQGRKATYDLLRARYYWPGMKAQVYAHCEECHECTFAHRLVAKHVAPTRPTVGAYSFDSLVCDVCSMTLTKDEKYDKLIVFMDSLSRWVEAIPFKGDPTAEEVLDIFMTHIVCRYGMPRELRVDGGSNLANKLAETIHQHNGVDLRKGAKYHPESQGLAERFNQTLTKMCVAANEGGSHWADHLPFLLFSYRATPHRITNMSPAMVLYGRELRLPAQLDSVSGSTGPLVGDLPQDILDYAAKLHDQITLAWDAAREATAAVQEVEFAEAHRKYDTSISFKENVRVLYRTYEKENKCYSPWFGPVRVLSVEGSGNYRLRDLPNNIMDDKFHVKELRRYSTHVDANALTDDEFIVDRLVDHRDRGNTRDYRVKWRQYPLSQSSWVSRKELNRRCAELVDAYDAIHPPNAAPPKTARKDPPAAVIDAPAEAEEQNEHDYESADLPHVARRAKGKWTYGRKIATPRGLQTRWFESSAFTPAELSSSHFASLRENATDN